MIFKLRAMSQDDWDPIPMSDFLDLPGVKEAMSWGSELSGVIQDCLEAIRRGERQLAELSRLYPDRAAGYAQQHEEGVLDIELEIVDRLTAEKVIGAADFIVDAAKDQPKGKT
jgi:hypothetical protein